MKTIENPDLIPAEAHIRAHTSTAERNVPVSVLFIIDELCESGGAERALLKTIRLLPPDQFRCLLVTFNLTRGGIFDNLPCPTYLLPLVRTYDLNGLRVAMQLRQLIRREHVSVVTTLFETSDLWAGMIARLSGAAVLVSSRRDMGILRSAKHEIAYKVANRFYDAIFTVSEKVRQRCIEHDRVPPDRVTTVYNSVDLDQVDRASSEHVTRDMLSIGENAPIVATIGHVRRIKGVDIMIRAAAAVQSKFPDVVFLVVGDITEQNHYHDLQELCRTLHLESTVRFIGSSESVFSLLKLCDVFCLPSRSEGFSNALIEAMACRKPCVATRVGGNDEALEDGVTGYLVDSEDAASMAERIGTLLSNRQLAARMGQEGRKVVEARFSDEVIARQLTGLYGSLLRKRS